MNSSLQQSQTVGVSGPWPRSGAGLSRLMSTSASAFVVLAVGAGIGCVAQIGTVRLIGVESFGNYAYVIAWTTMLGYIATLGFHVSLLRLVPSAQVRSDWASVRGVIRLAIACGMGIGILLAALGWGAVLAFGSTESELGAAFLVGLICVPLMALRLIQAAAVRAFGGVIRSMVPERIVRDSLALALLAALVWAGITTADAVTAMAAVLASTSATVWLLARHMRDLAPSSLAEASPRYDCREWLRPAAPLTVIMLSDVLMSRAGVLVLGFRGDVAEAGIFTVAFGLALLAALPRMAIAGLFAPLASELHERSDLAGLQSLSTRASVLSLVSTAVVAVPLIGAASILLSWFGPEFAAAHGAMIVLTLGQLVAAAAGPQQHLITMTGNETPGAVMMAAAAALNLVTAVLLCMYFGMMGAAVAASASIVAWNVGMAIFLQRRLALAPGLAVPLGIKVGSNSGIRP